MFSGFIMNPDGGGIEIVASDPVTGSDGDQIYNTSDNQYKIWYDTTWHIIAQFDLDAATYDFMDGTDYLFMDDTGFDYMDA